MIGLLWDKFPSYIKYPLLVTGLLFLLPLRLREEAVSFVRYEVHAVVMPMKERRDIQLLQLEKDIHTIKQDTRDIRNYLLGEKK